MLNNRLQVYLAGKVNGAKWEFAEHHKLNRIADYFSSDSMDTLETKAWNHVPPSKNGLSWVDAHYPVQEYVIKQLHNCDLLVAYLDTSDAYGTIAEIAYTSALEKPCVVVLAAPIEGETLYDPNLYADAGDIPDSEFQQILEDGKKYCAATDAYWLVCCFPNVYTVRESADFNLNSTILHYLKYHYRRQDGRRSLGLDPTPSRGSSLP